MWVINAVGIQGALIAPRQYNEEKGTWIIDDLSYDNESDDDCDDDRDDDDADDDCDDNDDNYKLLQQYKELNI